MAGHAQDLEKQGPATHPETPPIQHHPDHRVPSSALEKDVLTTVTRRSLTTSHTHSSTDTDPLSPLEHALARPLSSADIEELPPDDPDDDDDEEDGNRNSKNNDPLHLTRTRTSVISSASRLPDFEVTLEADDPENPRNWLVASTCPIVYHPPLPPSPPSPLTPFTLSTEKNKRTKE